MKRIGRYYETLKGWTCIKLDCLSGDEEIQLRIWCEEYEGLGMYDSGLMFLHIERKEDLIMCKLALPFLSNAVIKE